MMPAGYVSKLERVEQTVFTIQSYLELSEPRLAMINFRNDRCLSPNYGARKLRTGDIHAGLNSRRRDNLSSLRSKRLHNEGKWQRVIGLLQFPTTVTGIQRRLITGGLD